MALPCEFTIRFFDAGYSDVSLDYDDGATELEEAPSMSKEGPWFVRSLRAAGEIAFRFLIDGNFYPSSSVPYRALCRDIWVKEGIVFDYDPLLPRPQGRLRVLSVNLHTYQESDALMRLKKVAEFIALGQVDVVALQECAQSRASPVVEQRSGLDIREDNMARIIAGELKDRFGLDYSWYWDWSHYGFDYYEEGSALMGRPGISFLGGQTRYVSQSGSKTSIDSRTALAGFYDIPGLGKLDVFSIHLSWGAPQGAQIDALKAYSLERALQSPSAAIICGDFNMNYGEAGYKRMLSGGQWLDAYALASPRGVKDPTFSSNRIDYQFLRAGSALKPLLAQRVFLPQSGPEAVFTRVSDHLGVLIHYLY